MTDTKRIKQLISAMLDESISNSDMQELDLELKGNPQAREIYRRYVDMHFSLTENADNAINEFPGLPAPQELPETFKSLKKKLLLFKVIAACLAMMSAIALLTKKTPQITALTKEVQKTELLATISAISADIQWQSSAHNIGDNIHAETLIIDHGEVQLTYQHGTTVKIKGPAHFTLHSLGKASFKYGQLAAKVPEAAQGFTIDAHNATIVDLGTEFALNVTKSGKSQVYVYEGEVESSLLGKDGNTLINANLLENDAVEIDGRNGLINEVDNTVKFIRIKKEKQAGLVISEKYPELIKRDSPVGYWRFEEANGSIVVNSVSNKFSGRLTHDAQVKDKALKISKGKSGAMIIDEPFKAINQNGYTIEMWLNVAEQSGEMSLASLVEPEPVKGKRAYNHLTYIQLMSNTKRMRHRPFDFRFSHRHPATQNYGKNIFAGEPYKPGKWYHLVCVKENHALKLYLNGVLKQSINDISNNDARPYKLYIGKIDPNRLIRQFYGLLDEIAIYKKALTPADIKRHFEAAEVK